MAVNIFGKDISKMLEVPPEQKTDGKTQIKVTHNLQQTQSVGSKDFFKSPTHIKTAASLANEPMYRISPHRYHKLLRGYLRQDWDTINLEHGNDELRAGWIDILFDLIFVACVVHISVEAVYSIPSAHHEPVNYNEGCHSKRYDFVLTCFAQFGILSLFWMEQTMIETHFVFNQTMDVVLELIYFAFVLSAGLFIENDETFHIAFQFAYILVRFISCLYYFKSYLIPRARLYSLWHLIINTIVIISLITISIAFRGCTIDYFILYSGLFTFEYMSFVVHWCIKNKKGELKFALAVHVSHIAERFGLFVMLILGEAILSIMTSHMGSFNFHSIVQILFTILTFVLCFFIGKLYFDCQPNEHCIMHKSFNHALKTDIQMRVLYICLHHILFFGLLGFGIGIKIAFKHFKESHKELIDIILPSYSVVVIVISLNFIRLSHPNKVNISHKIWFGRFVLIMIMSAIPIIASSNEAIVFCVILFCVIGLNLMDVEGKYNNKEIKNELKEKRKQEKNQQKHEACKNIREMKEENVEDCVTVTPQTPFLRDDSLKSIYKLTAQNNNSNPPCLPPINALGLETILSNSSVVSDHNNKHL